MIVCNPVFSVHLLFSEMLSSVEQFPSHFCMWPGWRFTMTKPKFGHHVKPEAGGKMSYKQSREEVKMLQILLAEEPVPSPTHCTLVFVRVRPCSGGGGGMDDGMSWSGERVSVRLGEEVSCNGNIPGFGPHRRLSLFPASVRAVWMHPGLVGAAPSFRGVGGRIGWVRWGDNWN